MTLTKSKKLSRKTTLLLFSVMCALLLIPVFAVVTHSAKASELNATQGMFHFSAQDENQGYIKDQTGRTGGFETRLYKEPDDTDFYFTVSQSGQVIVNCGSGEYSIPRFDSDSNEQINAANNAQDNNFSAHSDFWITVEAGSNTLTPVGRPGYTFNHWIFVDENGTYVGNPEINKTYRWVEGAYGIVAQYEKCAQLSGTVIYGGANDIEPGQPVEHALVEFFNNSFYSRQYTDSYGKFTVSADDIQGGILEITYPGFRSYRVQLEPSQIKPETDLGEIQLFSVENSIKLSGTIFQMLEGEKYGVGGAYIYFVPDDKTKDPIFSMSESAGTARRLSNGEEGSYSMFIDKNQSGTLNVYKNIGGETGSAQATARVEASDSDITCDVELEFDENVKIITFSSPEGGTISVNNEVDGDIDEASFLTANYAVGNQILTDWDTGAITIIDSDGVATTYTPNPKEGYAYYDWSIRNFDDSPIPLKFEDKVQDNTHYTVLYRPAGKYVAVSDDAHHKEFKCTHTSQEFPDEVNFHKGASLEEELYAGTEITLMDGKLVCRYTDPAETTYWKQDTVEAIGQDGYVVDKYYVNGAEFNEGDSITVAQNDTVLISASYPAESNTAQTGDYLMIIGLMLGLIALGSGIYVVRKRSKN